MVIRRNKKKHHQCYIIDQNNQKGEKKRLKTVGFFFGFLFFDYWNERRRHNR